MKPAELVSYLIETYSNREDVVLDPTMHKGLTGAQCRVLDRHFIGIEKHAPFFEHAKERLLPHA